LSLAPHSSSSLTAALSASLSASSTGVAFGRRRTNLDESIDSLAFFEQYHRGRLGAMPPPPAHSSLASSASSASYAPPPLPDKHTRIVPVAAHVPAHLSSVAGSGAAVTRAAVAASPIPAALAANAANDDSNATAVFHPSSNGASVTRHSPPRVDSSAAAHWDAGALDAELFPRHSSQQDSASAAHTAHAALAPASSSWCSRDDSVAVAAAAHQQQSHTLAGSGIDIGAGASAASDAFSGPFTIPSSPPRGRRLVISILSTWGDPHYVGMSGIEVFDADGRLMRFDDGDHADAAIRAFPSSVNDLPVRCLAIIGTIHITRCLDHLSLVVFRLLLCPCICFFNHIFVWCTQSYSLTISHNS
jgi:hypothetical protein